MLTCACDGQVTILVLLPAVQPGAGQVCPLQNKLPGTAAFLHTPPEGDGRAHFPAAAPAVAEVVVVDAAALRPLAAAISSLGTGSAS